MDVQKPLTQNISKSSEGVLNEHPSIPVPSASDGALSPKVGILIIEYFEK